MSKRSGQARIGTERLAKVCVGLPLMVKPSQAAFAEIDESLREVAATLGARPWQVIMKIGLPQARLGILAVLVLASGRAMGEVGVSLMLGAISAVVPRRCRWLSTTMSWGRRRIVLTLCPWF